MQPDTQQRLAPVIDALENSSNAMIVSSSAVRIVYQVGKYDRHSIRPDETKSGYRYGKLVNGKLDNMQEFFCPGWEFPLRNAGVELADTGYRVELVESYQKLIVKRK